MAHPGVEESARGLARAPGRKKRPPARKIGGRKLCTFEDRIYLKFYVLRVILRQARRSRLHEGKR